MNVYELLPRYRALFDGLNLAFGTGQGRWIKRPPCSTDFVEHLEGMGSGIGIAPLKPDGTVKFAAIDLDAPDFDLAREFQKWIPGASWVERSRSGNAHVWVFFSEPCAAWVATGILKYAIESAGAKSVEVFPKQTSFDRVRLGNYINLPYHGIDRPILWDPLDADSAYELENWMIEAEANLIDPRGWLKRAAWLMIEDPALKRSSGGSQAFGEGSPHMCADYVIEGAVSGERPIAQGHRSVVYFNLAKQLANSSMWTQDEVLEALIQVRDASDHQLDQPLKPTSELERYVRNVYDKQYTSTGCDDPVFVPYADPRCPIANP